MSEINDTSELPEGILPINLNTINQYQRKYPSLKAKYNIGTYNTASVWGGSNIYINLITCEDKVVILSKFQSYELHWEHTYLIHAGMDRI